jgi:hypothetical protein
MGFRMNITSELLLEYKKHHNKEFNFYYFGDNNMMWECYTTKIRCCDADCLFDYNPHRGTLSMYTDFHLIYDATDEEVFMALHSSCNLKSWEEFEMYMKRYKVFERAALKFKKELIIESKKLELEDDFNADDD